jgi:GST-like protein
MHPPPLNLFGARTGNCLRVAIAFEEAKIPYVVTKVDIRGKENYSAVFLALNPAGKVPVIVDHGGGNERTPRILSQSNAILFHLADLAPGTLLPVEPGTQRSIAYERYFFFLTEVIASNHASFRLRSDKNSGDARQALDEFALQTIANAERFVLGGEFMSGEKFGLADIAAITIIDFYERDIEWRSAPALRRWYETTMNRPSVLRGMHAFDA